MNPAGPSLPIPEPVCGNEPGTWAETTIRERMPEIARRAGRERNWPQPVADALLSLADDLPHRAILPLDDPGAPDLGQWTDYVAPHAGRSWLEAPWFFAEAYFYRRMLAASGFFQDGPTHGLDPFGPEKQRGLKQGLAAVGSTGRMQIVDGLLDSLLGNRADLSLWPTLAGGRPRGAKRQVLERLLVDDRARALEFLEGLPQGPLRLDLVLDNAGQELLADFALVGSLLAAWPACRVVLHVKAHPTFVSDAVKEDVNLSLAAAQAYGGQAADLAQDLNAARRTGRLEVSSGGFWTSPLAGWEMPVPLRDDLLRSDLVIFKGDANYRRLLGDRHWPFATELAAIVAYFPSPLLCLRSIKAEVAAGIEPSLAAKAKGQDPDWMIDGQWSLIQFVPSSPPRL